MLTFPKIKKSLNEFAKKVVADSRSQLTKKKASGALSRSLKNEVQVFKNSIMVSFKMLEYGLYVDKGVKGKNPNELPAGAKNKGKQQAPKSPYKFGSGRSKSKGSLRGSINKWVVRKNLKNIRDKKGRFLPRKSAIFLISRSIFLSGIKPSLFFTKPFEKNFKRLPKDLAKQYGLDVKKFLDTTLKDKNL